MGATSLFAVSGRVHTTSGSVFEGDIAIDRKLGLVLTNAEIGVTNLPLLTVASAQFNLSANTGTNGVVVPQGALPAGWTNRDIGRASIAGKALLDKGNFTLTGCGTRLWTTEPDEFHFVYRRFIGDGQIVAQVTTTDAAMAGIMFRADLQPNSQFVLQAATTGSEGLIFRTRRDNAHRELVHQQGDWLNRDEIKPPCWVKLVRQQKRFTAFKSDDDGITWQPIYDSPGGWEREIFAGLFVMGGESNDLKSATFANVLVEDELDYKAKEASTITKIQVLLNDGSILAADSISSDQSKMRIGFVNTNYSASVFAVARLLFRPVPDRLKTQLARGRKGVLLNSGDFFEGELRQVDNEAVRVESILFGPRTFPFDKVLAIALSDSIELAAKYIVRTLDGSTIRAKAIAAGQDSLVAEELKLGPLEVPLTQLAEVKSGSGNY